MKKLYASCLILLTKDNKLILQKRDLKKGVYYAGCWGLIGGAAHDGEDARMCIERECYEETRWRLPFFRILFTLKEHCIETVFFSRVDNVDSLSCCEGEKLRAFEVEQLDQLNISSYHKSILNFYFEQFHTPLIKERQLRILFYTKVMPPALGGYVSAGCNLCRVLMSVGETTVVTDDTLDTVKGQYDLFFFNATYENSSAFDILKDYSDQVWSYEHNAPNSSNHSIIDYRYQESDIVLVPSQYLQNKYLEISDGVYVDKLYVLPIPIDFSCFDFKMQKDLQFNLTTICAIKSIRNLMFNIDIVKCLINMGVACQYDIYGMVPYMSDDSYLKSVKQYIEAQNLENIVKIQTSLSGSECISSTLKQYDFYLDFAQQETYGQAKIEALACGLIPIMPSVGNNPALLPMGEAMYDGTAEEIAKELYARFVEDNFLMSRREAYRMHAQTHFSDEIVSEMIKELL